MSADHPISTDESAPAESPIARLGRLTDLATPFAVRTLASLRIPDLIASGITGLDNLATAAGADPDALGRLLRYLAHRDVLSETEPDVFALTDVGELLRDHGPAGQRGWLDLDGLGARMDLAYAGLPHSIRTGKPAYETVHGRDYWAELDAEPQLRAYFDALMLSQQHLTAPQVAELYDWSSAGHVFDVGGGSGELLIRVLITHPHLRGTFVDRPIAASAVADRIAGAGLSDRATAVTGDFFAPLPPGGDVYVVSRALTDWSDADATTILRRCATAAGTDGRVLIVEVLPTEPHVPHLAPFDLQMLVTVGGRERSLDDFRRLAADAGLGVATVLHGRDGLVLLECAPSAA
jgi:2,7-dihydroxy-5-methyl-1-naphthoate 7-O-methyltransferase